MLTSHLFGAIRFWRTEALAEDLDAADADGSSEEAEAELALRGVVVFQTRVVPLVDNSNNGGL